jgi:hypothetical protein
MKIYVVLFGVVAMAAMSGCWKDDDDDNPSSSKIAPGTIYGNVMLVDSAGTAYLDYSGVKISLEGTKLQTTSDALGNWQIKDVPPGIYTIRCEKSGFGYVRDKGFQFVGNGESVVGNAFSLQTPPAFSLSLDSLAVDSNDVSFRLTSTMLVRYQASYILLINKTSQIDPLDSSNFVFEPSNYFQFVPGAYHAKFGTAYLRNERLISGQTYYARLYGIGNLFLLPYGNSAYRSSTYYDPFGKHEVHTATGPGSNVMSFVMP